MTGDDPLGDGGFLYVASGEPHKNHKNLLYAWRYLAEQGIRPKLVLTVDRFVYSRLCDFIEFVKGENNLDIQNIGKLSGDKLEEVYGGSTALIYPSTMESFGLPLIEARQSGLPIIAAELDYVRDLIDPEETFNPNSPRSIARAVKRFLGIPEREVDLIDASEFLKKLLMKADVT